MRFDKETKPFVHETRKRKWLLGLNAGAATLLAVVLFMMVNYLSYRHYSRWDVSRHSFYELSEKSRSMLDMLTNSLQVTVFFQPGQAVYQDIKNLLQEYEYVCPYLEVEWVDPDRDLARMEELMLKYDVDDVNVVVFDNKGRSRYVAEDQIATYDYEPLKTGQKPLQTEFKGEQAFSSAIQSVTQERRPVVYFIQGHGEGAPDDPDKRHGFSKIAREIERDNIDIKMLRFGEDLRIPEDCDVLIAAGPQNEYSMSELDQISAYLEDSGRMLVMLDAEQQSALDELLEDWGVLVGHDLVVDPTRTLTGRGDLYVTQYDDHPLTEHMEGITTVFYLPRSIRAFAYEQGVSLADKPQVRALVSTSPNGWGETNFDDVQAKFDADEDLVGPVSIAVAVEKGPVPGIDVKISPTRLLVFGDSDFVANKGVISGNADLFMSGLNWLLERDELMAISTKAVTQTKLIIDRGQRKMIFWIVVAGMPGCVALLGLMMWYRRRS